MQKKNFSTYPALAGCSKWPVIFLWIAKPLIVNLLPSGRPPIILNTIVRSCFFPEGTRSRTGKLNRFAYGAFELAIKEEVPILPIAIDGTQGALPKKSWKFGPRNNIRLKVLEPVSTEGLSMDDIEQLTDEVRLRILEQLSDWRNKPVGDIDGYARS